MLEIIGEAVRSQEFRPCSRARLLSCVTIVSVELKEIAEPFGRFV